MLGIGLDESTAIVVRGQQFEVTGASKVAIHDGRLVEKARSSATAEEEAIFIGPGRELRPDQARTASARPARGEQPWISRRTFVRGLAAASIAAVSGMRDHAQTAPASLASTRRRLRERIEALSMFGTPSRRHVRRRCQPHRLLGR